MNQLLLKCNIYLYDSQGGNKLSNLALAWTVCRHVVLGHNTLNVQQIPSLGLINDACLAALQLVESLQLQIKYPIISPYVQNSAKLATINDVKSQVSLPQNRVVRLPSQINNILLVIMPINNRRMGNTSRLLINE